MIEALDASRLKINFLIVTIYAGYPQSDSDENGTPLSERLFYFFDIQPRVSNDTRNRDALAIVAAFVRFNTLEILFTPALDFAIVFNVRTSSFDHARLTTFFFFGISFPFLLRTGLCITASFIDDLIFGKVV